MSPHIPIRTCVGCGAKKSKHQLLRIVRTPGGSLMIDIPAKEVGRGAYLCYSLQCAQKALKRKSLQRCLSTNVPSEFVESLIRQLTVKNG